MKYLESMHYEKHMRELGSFSPEKKEAEGTPYHSLQPPERRL